LDQTLINLERELLPGEDIKTVIQESTIPLVWIDIVTPSTGECIKTGFSIRPYAIDCLKQANLLYEVAIFTAGNHWYANPILDYLDPKKELIQHRFFRNHCTKIEEYDFYVKDLRIFKGIDLKNILFIDNYVYSFAFQLENGIPVVPFMGDPHDKELIKIIRYLKFVSGSEDMRVHNEKLFQLKKILNSNIESYIKYYDYELLSDKSVFFSSSEDDSPESPNFELRDYSFRLDH
jgi:Dullard-like phosphatase family protein